MSQSREILASIAATRVRRPRNIVASLCGQAIHYVVAWRVVKTLLLGCFRLGFFALLLRFLLFLRLFLLGFILLGLLSVLLE